MGDKSLTRSAYGVQKYRPEEIKEQWREYVRREDKRRKSHFINKSGSKDLIQRCDGENSINPTYFDNKKTSIITSTYDRMFHIQHGYCSRIHRDDREHTQGLDVHAEEQSKKVPLLSSSVYGHRPPLEVPSRTHVRVGLVKREFYRHCGATIPTNDQ